MTDRYELIRLPDPLSTRAENVSAAEFEPEYADEPLRQGDVFEWVGHSRLRPWQTFGMVVTADCDLMHHKTGEVVSYIPGLTTDDFVWSVWRNGRYDQSLATSVSALTKRVNRILQRPPERLLSSQAIFDWLLRIGAENLVSELGLTDNGQIRDLRSLIANVMLLHSLINANEPDINLLTRCHALKNGLEESKGETRLAMDLQSAMASLPGDIFHLPSLPEDERSSLFLMLRHIRQCPVRAIALRA